MYLWASLPAFRMEGSEIPLWFAKSSKGGEPSEIGVCRGRLLRPGLVVYCDRPEPSMVASSGLHHLSDYAYKDTTIF